MARTVDIPAGRIQLADYPDVVQFARREDDAQRGDIPVPVKRNRDRAFAQLQVGT